MLRNKNASPKAVNGTETPSIMLAGLRDHRVTYFALKNLTEVFSFRRLPVMGPALEVLESLDPVKSDWYEPCIIGDDRQAKATLDALAEIAKRDDGSWLSDEANLILADRGESPRVQEVQIPQQRLGGAAIQLMLF